MKKLFVRSMLLILIICLCFSAIAIASPSDLDSYLAAIIDKHNMLISTTSEPERIILVGGSNLAFGIDSELIEEETNIKTINMGLHAGIGLNNILKDTEKYIQSGDIIIIVPEYEHFYDKNADGESALYEVAQFDKSFILNIKPTRIPLMIISIFQLKASMLILSSTQATNDLYLRDDFNKHGDVIGHINKPSPELSQAIKTRILVDSKYNTETIKNIMKYSAYANSKGARVYLTYPSLMNTSYLASRDKVHKVEYTLNKSEINIVGTPEEFVYNDNLFYDTRYHLNGEGRNIRTNDLIKVIKTEIIR
ncbi:MAG: hypothetical protein AAGU14_10610 [Eubacteriaceae bacterium]